MLRKTCRVFWSVHGRGEIGSFKKLRSYLTRSHGPLNSIAVSMEIIALCPRLKWLHIDVYALIGTRQWCKSFPILHPAWSCRLEFMRCMDGPGYGNSLLQCPPSNRDCSVDCRHSHASTRDRNSILYCELSFRLLWIEVHSVQWSLVSVFPAQIPPG